MRNLNRPDIQRHVHPAAMYKFEEEQRFSAGAVEAQPPCLTHGIRSVKLLDNMEKSDDEE
jgi:hypothetical protein